MDTCDATTSLVPCPSLEALERAVAKRLQASCQSPVASFATLDGDRIELRALVASPDGSTIICETLTGPANDAENLGIAVADSLLKQGAGQFLGL